MTVRFNCPACNKALHAPDDKAGVEIACPGCKSPLRVPAAAESPQAAAAPSGPGGGTPEKATPAKTNGLAQKAKAKWRTASKPAEIAIAGSTFGGGCLVVVLFCCLPLGFTLRWAFGSSEPTNQQAKQAATVTGAEEDDEPKNNKGGDVGAAEQRPDDVAKKGASDAPDEVQELVKKFARLHGIKKLHKSKLRVTQAAMLLGRPASNSLKFDFILYENLCSSVQHRADAVFAKVGRPDRVLPARVEGADQEWVYYRGDVVIRCLVSNITYWQKKSRGRMKLEPGDTLVLGSPGLVVGGGRDF